MKIGRRQTLQLGIAAGIAAALPWRFAHAQDLIHKTIPSSGETLPVIGIGTARRYDVGESEAERAPLRDVLAAFTKMGGRVIDTAPTYGQAEQVSGDLVRAIGNRDAEQRILPLAAEHGMAVLINLPYSRGKVFSKVKGNALPDWAAEFDAQSWGQFFLKFVVSHPAVTCAIPGTAKMEYLLDNLGAARGRLPDVAMRKRMQAFVDSV